MFLQTHACHFLQVMIDCTQGRFSDWSPRVRVEQRSKNMMRYSNLCSWCWCSYPQPPHPNMSRIYPLFSHPQEPWLEIGRGPQQYLTPINNPCGAQEVPCLLQPVQAFGHGQVIMVASKLETYWVLGEPQLHHYGLTLSDPDKVDATLTMPCKGSAQISEIPPTAAAFLINYTHTLYHRERGGERARGLI